MQLSPVKPTLSREEAKTLLEKHGSPLYIYDLSDIEERAKALVNLNLPFGLTVRYATKANPHPQIVSLMDAQGVQFDASSSYEAQELLNHGISGSKISLSSQQPAHNLQELLSAGVKFVATSMHQMELLAAVRPKPTELGLRVNPGFGSGHINRLTTGGRGASFGLWHESIPDALDFANRNQMTITKLHVHVGTGGDPSAWGEIMDAALDIASRMPDVTTLDIGGGYKISYADGHKEADMVGITGVFAQKLETFAGSTGRKLHLEIEPGRWLVARSGSLISEVTDIVSTGSKGYTFLRINTGMNDFMRSAMYGANHRIEILNDANDTKDYVVVGHNCETSDILTPIEGDPEGIAPRRLPEASIGDILVVRDTGAYCASMRVRGYNSFPDAAEFCFKG
jgi:diaminopimelate decarboxylase